MSSPVRSPSPPHQYPQEIQLKLYQAFIFSIPILFSIILFLLFYLFYLKRRASALSSPILPRSVNNDAIAITTPDSKNELKNKMCRIVFDEYMKARDSSCCVCLGEFETKEELLQVISCKHMFHVDCICHWLHNNSTCPLCRAPVLSHVNKSQPHQLVVVAPQVVRQHSTITYEGSSSSSGGAAINGTIC